MVTPANNALFVINGKARTVNCEIGGVLHPIDIVWIPNRNNHYSITIDSNTSFPSSSSKGHE